MKSSKFRTELTDYIDALASDTRKMLDSLKNMKSIPDERRKHLNDDLGELVFEGLYASYRSLGDEYDDTEYFWNMGVALIAYGALAGEIQQGDFISSLKSSYGKMRLERDTKQASKAEVKKRWLAWQDNPTLFKSKVAFAEAMLDEFDVLTSDKVITNWCRDWEKMLVS